MELMLMSTAAKAANFAKVRRRGPCKRSRARLKADPQSAAVKGKARSGVRYGGIGSGKEAADDRHHRRVWSQVTIPTDSYFSTGDCDENARGSEAPRAAASAGAVTISRRPRSPSRHQRAHGTGSSRPQTE